MDFRYSFKSFTRIQRLTISSEIATVEFELVKQQFVDQ